MSDVTREEFDRLARAVNRNASDAQMRLERIEYERDVDSFRKRLEDLERVLYGIAAERMREVERARSLGRTRAWKGKRRLPNLRPFGVIRPWSFYGHASGGTR